MTTTKKTRRNPDEIIAELEARIARVKARAVAREVKKDPEVKQLLAALKGIDQAAEAAKTPETVRALESARAPIATRVVEMGLRLPDRRVRRKGLQNRD